MSKFNVGDEVIDTYGGTGVILDIPSPFNDSVYVKYEPHLPGILIKTKMLSRRVETDNPNLVGQEKFKVGDKVVTRSGRIGTVSPPQTGDSGLIRVSFDYKGSAPILVNSGALKSAAEVEEEKPVLNKDHQMNYCRPGDKVRTLGGDDATVDSMPFDYGTRVWVRLDRSPNTRLKAFTDDLSFLGHENPTVEAPSEVRVTDPVTGGQKGKKPEAYALIPIGPLAEVARVYGAGAEKYSDRNWEKSYPWSLSYSALNRHQNLFWGGESYDKETGCHHLASVVFHAFALMEWELTHPETDDRPKNGSTIERRLPNG